MTRHPKCGRRIKREKVDAIIAKLVERARLLNAEAAHPMWVRRLTLFGSAARGDRDDYGDVDVAYVIELRPGAAKRPHLSILAARRGIVLTTLQRQAVYDYNDAFSRLRGREPYLSLQPDSGLDFSRRRTVLLFSDENPPPYCEDEDAN